MNIELDEQDMNLILEALAVYKTKDQEALDNHTRVSEISNSIDPDLVAFIGREMTRIDELWEKIFAIRYKIDSL